MMTETTRAIQRVHCKRGNKYSSKFSPLHRFGEEGYIPLQYSSHSFYRWDTDKIETAVESGNFLPFSPQNPKIQ